MKYTLLISFLLLALNTQSTEVMQLSNEYYQFKGILEKNSHNLDEVYQSSYSVFKARLNAIGKKCEVLNKKQALERKGELAIQELNEKKKDKNYKPKVTNRYNGQGLINGSHLTIIKKRNLLGDQNLINYTASFQKWLGTISMRLSTTFGKDKGFGLIFSKLAFEVDEALNLTKNHIEANQYSNCHKQISLMLETREI